MLQLCLGIAFNLRLHFFVAEIFTDLLVNGYSFIEQFTFNCRKYLQDVGLANSAIGEKKSHNVLQPIREDMLFFQPIRAKVSDLAAAHFPALGAGYTLLFRVLIGSLHCLCLL